MFGRAVGIGDAVAKAVGDVVINGVAVGAVVAVAVGEGVKIGVGDGAGEDGFDAMYVYANTLPTKIAITTTAIAIMYVVFIFVH